MEEFRRDEDGAKGGKNESASWTNNRIKETRKMREVGVYNSRRRRRMILRFYNNEEKPGNGNAHV